MNDTTLYLRTILSLVAVLALIGVITYLIRRFGSDRFKLPRGRRRLSIVEVVNIDTRRRLVLIKRDASEHLLLIGGPNDLVVETGLVPSPDAAPINAVDPTAPGLEPKSTPQRVDPVFRG